MVYRTSVGQLAYEKVRARLLAGAWPPGTQLDIGNLAELATVSATPMREALHRLAAERLIDNRRGQGFFVPRPSEHELRALYRWWERLARMALATGSGHSPRRDAQDLFAALASAGRDPELAAALAAAADRLRPYERAVEALVGPPPPFLELAASSGLEEVRRRLHRHAAACIAAVPAILMAAQEPPENIPQIDRQYRG